MFNSAVQWFTRHQQRREALMAVIAYFEKGTGQRAIQSMCSILAEEPDQRIIRICYGNTRPRSRAWFSVSCDNKTRIRELSWEEVQKLGERPWR